MPSTTLAQLTQGRVTQNTLTNPTCPDVIIRTNLPDGIVISLAFDTRTSMLRGNSGTSRTPLRARADSFANSRNTPIRGRARDTATRPNRSGGRKPSTRRSRGGSLRRKPRANTSNRPSSTPISSSRNTGSGRGATNLSHCWPFYASTTQGMLTE